MHMPLIPKHFRLFTYTQSRFKSTSNLISLLKSMPKDRQYIVDAQKQRQKIKERNLKYVPARVTLQVLGTGAEGAPRSLYIFSDQSRYLFNCGEGTQRLAHEHKMKLAKLEHIFITQSVWKNMGGLPGTALTIQDVGVPQVTLHGPDGLVELFAATKKFVVMRNLKLEMADCHTNNTYKDNVMMVTYVPLTRVPITEKEENVEDEIKRHSFSEQIDLDKGVQAGSSITMDVGVATDSRKSRKRRRSRSKSLKANISDDDTDYYEHESKVFRSKGRSRSTSRSPSGGRSTSSAAEVNKEALKATKDKGQVMAYVCRLQHRPGTLNLEKCVNLGVPAGPLLGQLKSGIEVKLDDGKVIKPMDVCEPDDPGPVFMVVDCPTEEYLDALICNQTLSQHQACAKRDEDLACLVVHFSPKHIIKHPRYQKWLDCFSPSTQHLLINDTNTCMGSISVHRIQYKLNLLSKEFFPLLGDQGSQLVSEDNAKPLKLCAETGPHKNGKNSNGTIQPKTFCSFHVRPKTGLDHSTELKLNPSEYIEETLAVDGFDDELSKLKINLANKTKNMIIRPYPKVLFLGTGSCIPNKTRNTSGILLQSSDTSNILIDCGEGTYGQIIRFFGETEARNVLANTDAVYVSHLHADHHIGLIGFLQGRRRARELLKLEPKAVYLFAPRQILSWLNFYDLCFEDIEDEYELIPNGDILYSKHHLDAEKETSIFLTLNMSDISTCHVKHCPNAFGVTFTHRLGKITYSGDTMPSENLIELGMNSDLLIHEATMEDELSHEAIVKMHSTTSQAITVGQKMKAKNIILTHFSQRYAKLPRFNENFTDNVGIAFDNMIVTLDELPLMPLLNPALKLMFAEHYEELENKAIKRQMRLEREKDIKKN